MIAAADPERYAELAEAAEVPKNRFTLGQILDLTEEIYRRLAARRHG